MKNLNLLILLSLFTTTGCSMFDRRDYYDQMLVEDDGPMFRANQDFMVVAGDNGRDYRSNNQIKTRTPYSERSSIYSREEQSLKREATHLENKLSDSEYDKYSKIQDEFRNSSEKIYFLRLSRSEREEYLRARKIGIQPRERIARMQPIGNLGRSPASFGNNMGSDIQQGQSYQMGAFGNTNSQGAEKSVNLGMGMEDVSRAWGAPERRDIAGNPEQMNERWAYREGGEVKYIYFEAGRVEGWDFEPEQF